MEPARQGVRTAVHRNLHGTSINGLAEGKHVRVSIHTDYKNIAETEVYRPPMIPKNTPHRRTGEGISALQVVKPRLYLVEKRACVDDEDGKTPEGEKVHVSAEGHSVSLPFQCNAIHPLGDAHGILLERKEDQEDLEARKVSEGFRS